LKEGFDHASPLKTLLTAFLGRLRAFNSRRDPD
jgi:hypothetical protein